MKHTKISVPEYCNIVQQGLHDIANYQGLGIAYISDVVNIIKFRGTDYAEAVYLRHEDKLNKYFEEAINSI